MDNDFEQIKKTNEHLEALKKEFEFFKFSLNNEKQVEKMYNRLAHDMFSLRKNLKSSGLYKGIDNGYVTLNETSVNEYLLLLLNTKANEIGYFVYADVKNDKFGNPYCVSYNLTNKQRDPDKVLRK